MNKFGKRLLKGGIQQALKKIGIKAGLRQSFHPHVCRHTFATNIHLREKLYKPKLKFSSLRTKGVKGVEN